MAVSSVSTFVSSSSSSVTEGRVVTSAPVRATVTSSSTEGSPVSSPVCGNSGVRCEPRRFRRRSRHFDGLLGSGRFCHRTPLVNGAVFGAIFGGDLERLQAGRPDGGRLGAVRPAASAAASLAASTVMSSEPSSVASTATSSASSFGSFSLASPVGGVKVIPKAP